MGWSYGEVNSKPVGYSVPDICNHPECDAEIDRGLSYACGDMPGNGFGCDGFFCSQHLHHTFSKEPRQLCAACMKLCHVCAVCEESFTGNWDDARAEGWISCTMESGEPETFCPECHAGMGE